MSLGFLENRGMEIIHRSKWGSPFRKQFLCLFPRSEEVDRQSIKPPQGPSEETKARRSQVTWSKLQADMGQMAPTGHCASGLMALLSSLSFPQTPAPQRTLARTPWLKIACHPSHSQLTMPSFASWCSPWPLTPASYTYFIISLPHQKVSFMRADIHVYFAHCYIFFQHLIQCLTYDQHSILLNEWWGNQLITPYNYLITLQISTI